MSNQSQRPTTDPVKQALSYAQLPRGTKDITGQRFGHLTVVRYAGRSEQYKGSMWLCRCDCGQDKLVLGTHMRLGISKSCGCGLRYEAIAKAVSTHGKSDSPEWGIWSNMKTRCYNPNGSGYASYGGRGIAMCERWRESFESFLSDMGPRPGPDYQLDRIDNNGNYEPGNCRWVTRSDNCRNRRSNRRLAFQGQTLTVAEWSDVTGISVSAILYRLRHGWSIEQTLTIPNRVTSRFHANAKGKINE